MTTTIDRHFGIPTSAPSRVEPTARGATALRHVPDPPVGTVHWQPRVLPGGMGGAPSRWRSPSVGAAEHLPPLEGHAPPPPPVQDPQLSPERGGPRLPPLTPARRLGAPAHRPGARTPPSCCGYVGAGEGRRGGWTGSQLGRKTGVSWIRFSKEGQGSHRGGVGGVGGQMQMVGVGENFYAHALSASLFAAPHPVVVSTDTGRADPPAHRTSPLLSPAPSWSIPSLFMAIA